MIGRKDDSFGYRLRQHLDEAAVKAGYRKNRLVIGYGNTLRGDDAVGVLAVEALRTDPPPYTRLIASHQLTPELALDIADAEEVYFVDAGLSSPEVQLSAVNRTAAPASITHFTTPASLLELARTLYNACPPAWIVTIPIENMDPGEGLTATAEAGLEAAVRILRNRLDIGAEDSASPEAP